MIQLDVTLPMPPSTNQVYRRAKQGKLFMTAEGRLFKEAAGLMLSVAAHRIRGNTFHVGQRFALTLRLHFADDRRCDLDNRIKLVQDALADALGFDDRHIHRLTVERGESDPARPRCELTLKEFGA